MLHNININFIRDRVSNCSFIFLMIFLLTKANYNVITAHLFYFGLLSKLYPLEFDCGGRRLELYEINCCIIGIELCKIVRVD